MAPNTFRFLLLVLTCLPCTCDDLAVTTTTTQDADSDDHIMEQDWYQEESGESFYNVDDDIDNTHVTNDDMVLYVAAQRRKEKNLGVTPLIPALTDRSFPRTVFGQHKSLTVVLFYLPFDPVGMLFLEHYQEAAKEILTRTGSDLSSGSHPLTRVNCYDWPDVCGKENITIYPTVHLYQNGKWRQQYRKALDKDVFVRTILLLHWNQPLHLTSEEEVQTFVEGRLPDKAYQLLDHFVLLKPSKSLAELPAFTRVVRRLETQMLFAVVDPDVQTRIGPKVGVVHLRKKDKYQPHDILTDKLDTENIYQFLINGLFHVLPELTFLNLPELYSRQQPMGILFYDTTLPESVAHKLTVVEAVKSKLFPNVTFCKMGVEEDRKGMAARLLTFYTDTIILPSFVLLSHSQGQVFVFNGVTFTDKKLMAWILDVQAGKISPSNHLKQRDWKPSGQHYDYLAMMDRQERKEEERRKTSGRFSNEQHASQTGGNNQDENMNRLRRNVPHADPDDQKHNDNGEQILNNNDDQNMNNIQNQNKNPNQIQDIHNQNQDIPNQNINHNPNQDVHNQNQEIQNQNGNHNQNKNIHNQNQNHNQNLNQNENQNQNPNENRMDENHDRYYSVFETSTDEVEEADIRASLRRLRLNKGENNQRSMQPPRKKTLSSHQLKGTVAEDLKTDELETDTKNSKHKGLHSEL